MLNIYSVLVKCQSENFQDKKYFQSKTVEGFQIDVDDVFHQSPEKFGSKNSLLLVDHELFLLTEMLPYNVINVS